MGAGGSRTDRGIEKATSRAASRLGKVAISGRYFKLPKRIEDFYDIEKEKVLGTGYNGSVFLAKGKADGLKYAVKGFHLHGVSKEKIEELETECEIFLSMDHPHVARLVAVYENEKMMYLVMECMEGGEVYERILRQKRFSEKECAQTVFQMLLSINYIHSKSIVHRDLKLENFLYEKKGGDHLKLIDFGFSKVWEKSTKMELSCGTLSYVAPEVLRKSYTSQCDLWSLGVITFILLFGYMPFGGDEQQQMANIKAGHYNKKPDKWAKVSKVAQEFVVKLLVVDPKIRLDAEKALAHPFISDREKRPCVVGEVEHEVAEALMSFAQASQFRRACMSMMAWSLTNEERAKVRDAFLKIDKNRQGTITMSELKEVLEKEFDIDDEKAIAIFASLDTAKDHEIHYSEFLAAMVSTRIAMNDSLLANTFEKFDRDNSGFITLDNLKEVLGDSFDGQEVDRLVAEADTNNDGKIDYNEFITFLKDGGSDAHNEAAARIVDQAQAQGGARDQAGSPMPQGALRSKSPEPGGCGKGTTPPAQQQAPAGTESQGQKQNPKSSTCVLL